jgi:hypothetical protein
MHPVSVVVGLALQLVLVVTPSWDATEGELRRFEKLRGGWRAVGEPVRVFVGEAGLAWASGVLHPPPRPREDGPKKREGDRRAPAGMFRLGRVYQRARGLTCVDDVQSADYNRIVGGAAHGEPMEMYRRALVVEQNPAGVRGDGSCIFLHDGGAPTVGCTAMAPAALDVLIGWLRDGLLVQLPRPVYERLRARWELP